MVLLTKTNDLIENYLRITKDHIIYRLNQLTLESPIEQIFATELIINEYLPCFSHELFQKILEELKSGGLPHCESDQDYEFVWVSQYEVGPYRTDFACLFYSEVTPFKKVIVECDGHDFHEKNKEQAAKDKKRDRYFQQNGWQILHFTGSELYHDSKKCVKELHDIYQGIFFEALERRHQLEGDEENA